MREEDEEKCFVKYNPRLFCHQYGNVIRIAEISWKGKLGWTTAPQEIIDKIVYL